MRPIEAIRNLISKTPENYSAININPVLGPRMRLVSAIDQSKDDCIPETFASAITGTSTSQNKEYVDGLVEDGVLERLSLPLKGEIVDFVCISEKGKESSSSL